MLFGFLLGALFVPWFGGAATTPRWALMAAVLPFLIDFTRPLPRSTWPWLAFLAWATLSLAWTPVFAEGLGVVAKLLILTGMLVWGSQQDSLEWFFNGLGLAFAVNCAVILLQFHGLSDNLPQVTAFGGLFLNKNFGAEAAAIVLVGLVYYRSWTLAAFPIAILAVSGARGALVAACAGLYGAATPRVRWLLLAGASASLLVAWAGPTGGLRLALWHDTLGNLTWRGAGAGGFYITYPAIADFFNTFTARPEHAHNDFLEVLYEFGPIGLGLLLVFYAGALIGLRRSVYALVAPHRMAETEVRTFRAEHAVLVTFLVEGCFGFPFFLPVTAAVAFAAAGRLCGHRVGVCADSAVGRTALVAGSYEVHDTGGGRMAPRSRGDIFPA